ncbi:aminotransferase [Sediminihabitans luteus]|uniref:type 1 glutamine amidotransferase n=1 Tax=Sediminihabitans luteus TaxID=1138585 RepID=UPI001A370092|nr:type 1 glutamine amidotransferase [Sediminihabitans luteus]GII97654.1 aminotransferase [Sediminihabitans luteus]
MNPQPVVTVVQSSPAFGLGTLADVLAERVRLVRPYAGDTVPALADAGDAVVVLGAETSAYDTDAAPWLGAVRALLSEALAAGTPVLGLGLGAQLLALAGGGQVQVAAPPGVEAGVTRVFWRPGACDDAVVGSVVDPADRVTPVVTLHADAVVDLPANAAWLGSTDMYPYQAFRIGSGLGLQFQPEVTRELLEGWLARGELADATAALDGFDRDADAVLATGRRIAEAFAATVDRHAGAGTVTV